MVFRMASVPFLYRFETQNGTENEKEVPTFGLSFQLFLTLSASAGFLWFFCKLSGYRIDQKYQKMGGRCLGSAATIRRALVAHGRVESNP